VDDPAGIGCLVIFASAGADAALLVVEPTVSSAHDLECILGTTNHFGVASLAVINKADLNPARADEIVAFCTGQGVEAVGCIPTIPL
jgi:MinD superfamily P-loop ATPase